MPIHVKGASTWGVSTAVWVKDAGVWKPAQSVFIRNAGAWALGYKAEVVYTITSNTAQANAQSFFSAADWANQYLAKKLIIAPGVNV
ncbi:MAG: hypothetical protein ACOH2R_28440 [Pseudomonas sp.]